MLGEVCKNGRAVNNHAGSGRMIHKSYQPYYRSACQFGVHPEDMIDFVNKLVQHLKMNTYD